MELRPIAKEWLAALRSGTIVQATGGLGQVDGSRCCLGVACDVAVRHGHIPPPVPVNDVLVYDDEHSTLPDKVMSIFGMKSSIGSYLTEAQKEMRKKMGHSPESNALSQDNDSKGKTFAEIADIIEANADQLFVSPVEELTARLRSGSVQQTTKVLGRPDGSRCCLGVASDIAVEHGIITAPTPSTRDSKPCLQYGDEHGNETSTSCLTLEVQNYFDFRTVAGGYGVDGRSLMEDNDNGKTFAEIADIIESRPEGLFVKPVVPAQPVVEEPVTSTATPYFNDPYAAQ